MLIGGIIGAVVVLLLVMIWAIYNKFVRARNIVEEALSGIDVQLKKRFELIPSLVECVKGYNEHEAVTLSEVVSKRVEGESIASKVQNDASLTGALRQFRVNIENYPDLKADSQFLILMKEISHIENELSMSRRYYNGTVRDFNTKLQVFPNVLFVSAFGMKNADFYELDAEKEGEVPDIKLTE